MQVFILHLLNENDINIFDILILHTTSVIGEVHFLNLINQLLLFLFKFISLMFDRSIHGRKNKNCTTKTLFTNTEEFVHYSTR